MTNYDVISLLPFKINYEGTVTIFNYIYEYVSVIGFYILSLLKEFIKVI